MVSIACKNQHGRPRKSRDCNSRQEGNGWSHDESVILQADIESILEDNTLTTSYVLNVVLESETRTTRAICEPMGHLLEARIHYVHKYDEQTIYQVAVVSSRLTRYVDDGLTSVSKLMPLDFSFFISLSSCTGKC
jgi:hypothetical protein